MNLPTVQPVIGPKWNPHCPPPSTISKQQQGFRHQDLKPKVSLTPPPSPSQFTSAVFHLSMRSTFSPSSRATRWSLSQLWLIEIQWGLDQQKYNEGYKCNFTFAMRHLIKKPVQHILTIFPLKTNISKKRLHCLICHQYKVTDEIFYIFSRPSLWNLCVLYLYRTSRFRPAPLYVLNSHTWPVASGQCTGP